MHTVYLGLGSNIGDREKNIQTAVDRIDSNIGRIVKVSSLYATDPVGFISENKFLNAACKVETEFSPLEVLEKTQAIEKEMGRKEKSVNHKYADRIIDIDILLYDELISKDSRLVLPHPYLHERQFVLLPLAEIAAEEIHPLLHKSIGELMQEIR
ncbi:MAG: 2-amino-4-hydroxy-6-hydroxymethyldihydropteridine diphosphokinase [Dysgonomonas sp.]